MSKAMPITIPAEPIGSISRPVDLIDRAAKGHSGDANLAPRYEDPIRDTSERFDSKPRASGRYGRRTAEVSQFLLALCAWLPNTAPDGFKIPFSHGHSRRLSRLARGAFRYGRYADTRSNSARIGAGASETPDF
jgi:5-methyltetrahydropteroyltriglutamate--homocysteine methyltransferase